MRILTLHCDYIKYKPLKKAFKDAEEIKNKQQVEINQPLVVLAAVEKGDSDIEVKKVVESIDKTAKEVKAENIVVYPYAHLSSNLSSPNTALGYLTEITKSLQKLKYNVERAPFGHYKEFELKVKGHPLSELSKTFVSELQSVKDESREEEKEDPQKILREIIRAKLDTSKLKENDHRILGQKLDLFSFNEVSPGSVFWHANGTTIYNELVNFSRELHKKAKYLEISTAQLLDSKLWKVSGHWNHYQENMFLTNYEGRPFGVKPMNCPGMMLVYKTKTRSYKELPFRLFEFGVVHRKELSGVLAGLFRVIRFTQDDAHIFVSPDQIESEISNILGMVKTIYKDTFGFEYHLDLSTRPEKFMGEIKDWDYAEKQLESALKKSKVEYNINKGDGAFYGPKIDIKIKDSLGREWQCATIQLDTQLPKRFDIKYVGEDNKEHTPIVIHRAIFGSVERFIGVLLEHLNGNLPVWLSPIQVRVINFTDRNTKTAEKIIEKLQKEIPFLRIDSDMRNTTVNDKIRDAELMKIPNIIVIGDKEEEKGTLAIRRRGEKKPEFGVKLEDYIKELKDKIEKRN